MSETQASDVNQNKPEVNENQGPGSGNVTTTTSRADSTEVWSPPSPTVDVHALFGIPRVKRPSERSVEQEDSDTDDLTDSDDDELEECQEGEYLVLEDVEEFRESQKRVLAEQADLHRHVLLPVFTACTAAYDKWVHDNKDKIPEDEMAGRRAQLELYRKALDLYGSDDAWSKLAHVQKISIDKEVLETSERAKDMGPPPGVVGEASVTAVAGKSRTEDTCTKADPPHTVQDKMHNLNL